MSAYQRMTWLHPLDRRIGLTCDCPCEGGKRKIGDYKNLGRASGRRLTYPLHSISYKNDVESLINSGLYFEVVNYEPQLCCVGCEIVIIDWVPGGDADAIHRNLSPDCFWLRRRDNGVNMEIDVGTNYSLPWPHTDAHIPFKMPRMSPPEPWQYEPSLLEDASSATSSPEETQDSPATLPRQLVFEVPSYSESSDDNLYIDTDSASNESVNDVDDDAKNDSIVNLVVTDDMFDLLKQTVEAYPPSMYNYEVMNLPREISDDDLSSHISQKSAYIELDTSYGVEFEDMNPPPLKPVAGVSADVCIAEHVSYWVDDKYSIHLIDSGELLPPSMFDMTHLDDSICNDEYV